MFFVDDLVWLYCCPTTSPRVSLGSNKNSPKHVGPHIPLICIVGQTLGLKRPWYLPLILKKIVQWETYFFSDSTLLPRDTIGKYSLPEVCVHICLLQSRTDMKEIFIHFNLQLEFRASILKYMDKASHYSHLADIVVYFEDM